MYFTIQTLGAIIKKKRKAVINLSTNYKLSREDISQMIVEISENLNNDFSYEISLLSAAIICSMEKILTEVLYKMQDN